MIITISILVYVISTLCMWKFIQISYGKHGRWSHTQPDPSDVFVMFCPLVNTMGCLIFSINGAKRKKPISLNKFFKIKK